MDEAGAFDLVTSFDAVHDMKDPQALLVAIHRALRPGGTHLMQDIAGSAALENNLDFPFAPFLHGVLRPLHAGVAGPGRRGASAPCGLGDRRADAGGRRLRRDATRGLPHDPMNVWFVSRKG